MKNHHEVGHFKNRMMIVLLSLVALMVMAGQSFATTCSTCHGMPPLDSVDGKRNTVTGAFKGSHQVHVPGPATATNCISCHNSATSYDMKHSATSTNKILVFSNISYSKGAFFNQTSIPIMGKCSNASCHSNVYGSGKVTTPFWGTTGNGCTACHSVAINATGPATGSHAKHNVTDCTQCHVAGTTATAAPSTGHANGNIDVTDGYPATVAKHAAGTYTGTCSTASCHANVYGTGTVTTPVWGDTTKGCSACHSVAINATGPATGSHAVHAVTDCSSCHAGATNNLTKPTLHHADGFINVTSGYPKNVAKHAAGTYAANAKCSTASCHSNVYGTGTVTTPQWGTTGNGCTACHSVAINTTGPATGSHVIHATTDCSNCHAGATNNVTKPTLHHADGFINVTSGYPKNVAKHAAGTYAANAKCSAASCHADVYGAGTILTPQWGTTGNGCTACHSVAINTTGPATGSHVIHATTDCSKCHAGATNNTTKPALHHADGFINVTSGYPKNVAKHTAGTYAANAKCSAASCHANVYGTGTVTTPQWGTTGNSCTACHSVAINTTGPATGSHVIHATTDCSKCHAGATNNTTMPTLHHADGFINVTSGYPVTAKHAAGTYAASAKCSTASCHANVYGTGSVNTPQWGTTGNGCSACHTIPIGANGPATGAHNKHAGVACATCHAAGTTATTAPTALNGHIDGNVDVYYFSYPANVAKHAAGSGYGTCSTAYCHSNGKGTYTSPNWGNTSTGCNFCHPNLSAGHNIHINTLLNEISFYAYTSNKSVGSTYKFGCVNCHPVTVANHMNNSVDIDLSAVAAGGSIKALNGASAGINASKQCLNVYCHSNGFKAGAPFTQAFATTPAWGGSITGDRCAACHGNSPNSTIAGSSAHSAHVIGIHVQDTYNGVSRKLPIGGAAAVNAAHGSSNRATTINCNICHALTVGSSANDKNSACIGCHDGAVAPLKGNATIIDASKHVNGTVDVSFMNQKIATKAQVAKTAFAAYTAAASGGWVRNNNIYKTYTSAYDVTKSTLLVAAGSYSQAAGCANVACHNNKTVKWTDTISCENCHSRLK